MTINFQTAVPDFYYLMAMSHRIQMADSLERKVEKLDIDVKRARELLEPNLAQAIRDYLTVAAVGEARYSGTAGTTRQWFIIQLVGNKEGRSGAYEIALKFNPRKFLPVLMKLFMEDKWHGSSVGGYKWGLIAKAALMYYDPKFAGRTAAYIDYGIDVEHNGGNAFNKSEASMALDILMPEYNIDRFLNFKKTYNILETPFIMSGKHLWLPSRKVLDLLNRSHVVLGTKDMTADYDLTFYEVENTNWEYEPPRWGSKNLTLANKVTPFGEASVFETKKALSIVLEAWYEKHASTPFYPYEIWQEDCLRRMTNVYRKAIRMRLSHVANYAKKRARCKRVFLANREVLDKYTVALEQRVSEYRWSRWLSHEGRSMMAHYRQAIQRRIDRYGKAHNYHDAGFEYAEKWGEICYQLTARKVPEENKENFEFYLTLPQAVQQMKEFYADNQSSWVSSMYYDHLHDYDKKMENCYRRLVRRLDTIGWPEPSSDEMMGDALLYLRRIVMSDENVYLKSVRERIYDRVKERFIFNMDYAHNKYQSNRQYREYVEAEEAKARTQKEVMFTEVSVASTNATA